MQLSKKEKKFSETFALFLKSPTNFEHFKSNDEAHSGCISEMKDCKIRI